MKVKTCATLLSVSVLLASLMAIGVGNVQAQEFPREQTMVLGGDESYTDAGFNPYNRPYTGNRAQALTYMSLFWYSWADGELKPWLAKSYEWSEDGSKFIINLRTEAKWRDGTPVTAEDVVFCFETLNQSGNFPLEPTIIESVTAADTYTVNINLVAGQEFSNRVLTSLQDMPIFSKARWELLLEEYGDEITGYLNEDLEDIDGSGPYLPTLSESHRVVYERVDDWWGNKILGQPAPKYVMVLAHATNDLEQRAFNEGTLDWTDSFMSGSYTYVMTHPDVVCWNKNASDGKVFNTAGAIYMVPNLASTEHPELAQPWLRQAVAYAIDLDRIMLVAQEGLVKKASPSFITPTGPMADEYIDHDLIEETYGAEYIPNNKTKAIEILEEYCTGSVEAGWKTKVGNHPIGPWEINTVAGWSDVNLMCELISEQLQKIGIKMEPNQIDYSFYESRMTSMDFDWLDFTLLDTAPSPTYPINGLDVLFRGDPGQWVNLCNYTSSPNYEEVNDLILEMWSLEIGSTESIDVAKQIQALVVPELPYIPLYVQVPWSRYHTTYWVGWPTIDNPGPGQGASWWDQIIPQVIFGLQPAPKPTTQTVEVPYWALMTVVGIAVIAIIAVVALVLTRRGSKKS
jgi:peptide/nickel transport system substrate-binding protein